MAGDIAVEQALDGACLSIQHPWSVLELSVPTAQLAGVLAGFSVAAITVLVSGRNPRPLTHTLSLLGVAVLVLGLDAYFFGSIAATKPARSDELVQIPVNNVGNGNFILAPANPHATTDLSQIARRACETAWLQFMPAAGLLAVGSAALVAGLRLDAGAI